MESWAGITVLLCTYGVFKEIRPSEPYLTEYLEGPWVNLTTDQVNHEVYPVWTYSYLCFLVVILITTDFVRYKPFLIIEGIAYVATWSFLLWGKGLFAMQMMQFVYAIATSTEVAYLTYIYSVVPHKVYQKVTSYARSALLFGRFISGVLSQVLISTKALDIKSLNYVSLASVTMAFFLATVLPHPDKSLYIEEDSPITDTGEQKKPVFARFRLLLRFVGRQLKICYADRDLLLWSLWWAFATCGNYQVGNYIQPLWEEINPTWTNSSSNSTGTLYNGAVEASHTLLGSIAAFSLGSVSILWSRWSEVILCIFSILDCAVLVIMAWTKSIWIAYISYIIFCVSFQMIITLVSYHVAKNLSQKVYGLIFGMNTFAAILLQTVITLLFVDDVGLKFAIREQFTMYGIFFGLLAAVFFIIGLIKWCSKCRRKPNI